MVRCWSDHTSNCRVDAEIETFPFSARSAKFSPSPEHPPPFSSFPFVLLLMFLVIWQGEGMLDLPLFFSDRNFRPTMITKIISPKSGNKPALASPGGRKARCQSLCIRKLCLGHQRPRPQKKNTCGFSYFQLLLRILIRSNDWNEIQICILFNYSHWQPQHTPPSGPCPARLELQRPELFQQVRQCCSSVTRCPKMWFSFLVIIWGFTHTESFCSGSVPADLLSWE